MALMLVNHMYCYVKQKAPIQDEGNVNQNKTQCKTLMVQQKPKTENQNKVTSSSVAIHKKKKRNNEVGCF